MKIKNTSVRSFFCEGHWVSPGETVTVSDESGMYWVDRGKATGIQVRIKEKPKEVIKHDEDNIRV